MEAFLAAMLLAAPPGTPEPPIPVEQWPALSKALQEEAVRQELLDPRETWGTFADLDDLARDLDTVRERARDLADAPLVWEAQRLPEKELIRHWLEHNREVRELLEAQKPWHTDRQGRYDAALRELNRQHELWGLARDAQCDYYHVTIRRQSLKQFRKRIGVEAYYAGTWPLP